MKKLTLLVFSLIFVLCAAIGFVSCKNSGNQGNASVKPKGLELQSSAFNIDNASKTAYLKVANAVEDYDFSDKFTVADGARFDVCTDKQCNNKIASKKTDLVIGDNVFYILVTNGNDVASYTVTIRRRPIYTVTFDTNGGSEVESQQVEEDDFAIEPTTIITKVGYNFASWIFDFSNPILQDETIAAKWTVLTYSITYELNGGENAESNPATYTIEDEITLFAPTKTGYMGSWSEGNKFPKGSTGNKIFTAVYTPDVKLSDDGAIVTGLRNTSIKNLVIFSEYNGIQVTKIDDSAFYNHSGLTSVTIPDSVTSIGVGAFSGCKGLMSVTIGNSVTSIGGSAFYGCSGLTSITIPNSVTSIGGSAFYGCSGLTSITIPNGVTSIGDSAFLGCSGLTSITIPDSVTSIGDSAFYNCSKLTSITIPDSVTSIGDNAFLGCNNLKYSEYENMLYLGNSNNPYVILVKAKDTTITSCMINNKTKFIHSNAFEDCSGLTSITIPDSVTSIGYYAFSGCSGLTGIEIPDSVTSIGSYAFKYCSGLTGIEIPNGVTSIGYSAFLGCNNLKYSEYGNALYLGNSDNPYVVLVKAKDTTITSCMINNKTKFIHSNAFYGCSGLTSVTISNSVTSIGYEAFYGCSGLTSVTIGDGVTSIGGSAFYNCIGLTSITIPDSVTSIGYSAFEDCSGLKNVTIGNGVTSIGDSAFSGCKGLMSVTIGNSVTSIGSSAFSGCKGLTSVTIGNSVTSIGSYAFGHCSELTSITIPDSVTSIGYSAFWGCGLKEIHFNGTKAQWDAIKKGNNWILSLYSFTIYCTDGNI